MLNIMHMHVMFRLVGGDASPPSPPLNPPLMHGLAEDESTFWEKRESTLQIFKKFLREGLQIEPE